MDSEKKDQLLLIDPPHELKFRGPFTRPVMTIMTLTNPTESIILFKIKTTAPKKYCVRPNFGAITPHSKIEVEICLQAFVFDSNEKNKHKFMVQSCIVPEGVENYQKLLKETDPEQFMNSKLRCIFEQPVETPSGGGGGDNSVTIAGDTGGIKENSIKNAGGGSGGSGDDKDIHANYKKATAEVGQLREETSQLRHENIRLKEQLLRLQLNTEANQKEQISGIIGGGTSGSSSAMTATASLSSSSPYHNPYSPPQLGHQQQQQQIPILYIIVAILMAIFGVLFGKYLL